jgi:hypothetical protein
VTLKIESRALESRQSYLPTSPSNHSQRPLLFRQAELLNFTNWRLAANAASPLHIGCHPMSLFLSLKLDSADL